MLKTRWPVFETERGTRVVLTLGQAEAEVGDELRVVDARTKRQFEGVVVVQMRQFPAQNITPGDLALISQRNVESFIRELSGFYGTALPASAWVTLYEVVDKGQEERLGFTIVDPDVEEEVDFDEVEEEEDDDEDLEEYYAAAEAEALEEDEEDEDWL